MLTDKYMKETMSMVSKKEKENLSILMDLSMKETSLAEDQEEMLTLPVAEKLFLFNILIFYAGSFVSKHGTPFSV